MVVLGASGSLIWSLSAEQRRWFRLIGQLLELEDRDLLRLAVLGYDEVARLEIFDGTAGLGFHRHIDDDQVAGCGEFRNRAVGIERARRCCW